MKISSRGLITALACVGVGATAGIVGSAAAPSSSSSSKGSQPPQRLFFRHDFRGGPFGHGGPAVHETKVVLNEKGNAFITETEDSGTVKSVSGNDLTISEAVGKVKYKDQTVTVPNGATVYRNGKKAALSDLKTGDFVHVESSSEGTTVIALAKSFRPKFGLRFRGGPPPGMHGFRHFRGGPPPGAPNGQGYGAPGYAAPPAPGNGA